MDEYSSSEAPADIDDDTDERTKENDSDKLYTGDELSMTHDRLFALPSVGPTCDSDSLTSDVSDIEVFFN